MVCPYCHSSTKVKNSRSRSNGFSVWRRRFCSQCQLAFTTTETVVIESTIKLRDDKGVLRPLSYEDILISLFKALEGLNQPKDAPKYLARTCLDKLFQTKQTIIDVEFLNQQIFETLHAYQPVAGQRFLINQQLQA